LAGRPEIDQDDLAPPVSRRDGSAVQSRRGEGGRRDWFAKQPNGDFFGRFVFNLGAGTVAAADMAAGTEDADSG
jgi:hypothetical protein